MVSNTGVGLWVASGLLAVGIAWGKYSKCKTRQPMVRELGAMDPQRREKLLSRMQPELQMEIREELMKRFRLKTDL